MKLEDVATAVHEHRGEFLCEQINNEEQTKTFAFAHLATAPTGADGVPDVGRLRDFYDTFGSVLFYHNADSGDAARHLAPMALWPELHADFSDWIDVLDDDERAEAVPEWVETCLVLGETPHSGNYILMATEGPSAGHVFEFDHDGFEFVHEADDMIGYVERLLKPDASKLVDMAAHMRFVESDPMIQWWILELKDNRGHTASTEA